MHIVLVHPRRQEREPRRAAGQYDKIFSSSNQVFKTWQMALTASQFLSVFVPVCLSDSHLKCLILGVTDEL